MNTKEINGKQVKITRAGYLYINGKKHHERKIDPFYNGGYFTDDIEIKEFCSIWANKNYYMCNG